MGHMSANVEIEQASPAVFEAWRCIGCGRIEAPQPCIGVCQDRKVRFVDAADYEDAIARLRKAEEQTDALEAIVTRLAHTRPRAGAWEQSYKALQDEAQRVLMAIALMRSALAARKEMETIEP